MILPSFASGSEATTYPIFLSVGSKYVEKIEGGSVLSQRTDDKLISITAQDAEHIINVSIRYVDIPNSIFQWTFYDYPVSTFNPDSSRFWSEIIDYAETRKEKAHIITFTCDTTETFPDTRSSANADLKEDLKSLHGIEYPYPNNPGVFLSRRNLYGHTFEIRETKTFSITKQETFSWKDGLTIASVLTNVLGIAFTSGTGTIICSVLGLTYTGMGMILPAAKVQRYACKVQYYRYVTIDNDGREYTGAFRNVSYSGYEDISSNSSERAYLVKETKYENYPQSEEYYNDYDAMYEEAYEYYKWTPGNT